MFGNKTELVRELLTTMGMHSKLEKASLLLAKQYSVYGLGEIVREAAESTLDKLFEDVVKLYNDKLDKTTVKKLLRFYKSDAGRKFVKASPLIEQDLIDLSARWQEDLLNVASGLVLKKRAEKGINARDYIPPLDMRH